MNPDSPQSPRDELEARLTALLLGELPADEAAALRETIAQDAELARLHDRLKLALELVRETIHSPELAAQAKPEPVTLAPERRDPLLALFKQPALKPITRISTWRAHRREWLQLAAMIVALMVVTGMLTLGLNRRDRERYKDVLNGEEMPPLGTRLALRILDLAGLRSEDSYGMMWGAGGDLPTPAPVAAYAMIPESGERFANPVPPPAPPESVNEDFAEKVENQVRTRTVEAVPPAKPQNVTTYSSRGSVRLEPKGEMAAPKLGSGTAPAKKLAYRSYAAAPTPSAPPSAAAQKDAGAKPGATVYSVNAVGFVDVNNPAASLPKPTAAPAGRPAIQDQERGEVAARSSTAIALPLATVEDLSVVNESLGESRRDAIADTDREAKSLGYRFGTFAGPGQAGGGMGGGGGGRLAPAGGGAMKDGRASAKAAVEFSDNFRSVDDLAEGLKRDAKPQEMREEALKASDLSINLSSPAGRRVLITENLGQQVAEVELLKKQSGC